MGKANPLSWDWSDPMTYVRAGTDVMTFGTAEAGYQGASAADRYIQNRLGIPRPGDLKPPPIPAGAPAAPDAGDVALRNARLMERRRQLGLLGRMSTFLTTADGDKTGAVTSAPTITANKVLLGT